MQKYSRVDDPGTIRPCAGQTARHRQAALTLTLTFTTSTVQLTSARQPARVRRVSSIWAWQRRRIMQVAYMATYL